jgi:hypothetical protein
MDNIFREFIGSMNIVLLMGEEGEGRISQISFCGYVEKGGRETGEK